MWKPVRLQGVGAASTIIDADPIRPAIFLSDWRLRMVLPVRTRRPNGVLRRYMDSSLRQRLGLTFGSDHGPNNHRWTACLSKPLSAGMPR